MYKGEFLSHDRCSLLIPAALIVLPRDELRYGYAHSILPAHPGNQHGAGRQRVSIMIRVSDPVSPRDRTLYRPVGR